MDRYTLIITEKPDAANRIAIALDEKGVPKKVQRNGVPYYEAYNNGKLVVVPALGHLYTIASKYKSCRTYPIFEYEWVPLHLAQPKAARIRTWLNIITKLAQNAEIFVDACDFDIEGSIIGYSILKYACGEKEKIAKRMKYSTLTIEELQASFNNLLPTLDFALIEAGLTRHETDWLFGINLSRALTQAAKASSGKYTTLSTGRVQGPTLKFLQVREQAIQCFVPTPYWTLTAKIKINHSIIEVEYEKTLETYSEATTLLNNCKVKEALINNIETKENLLNPPFPFDLTSLQSEAYRLFRLTPIRTSKILQRLYLAALISYPRTSSQKLPLSIGYKTILNKLAKKAIYKKQANQLLSQSTLKPNEGKKIDPAHPAIYPTGNLPEKSLTSMEQNILDLVIKRFFAVFSEPAVLQNTTVVVGINGEKFAFSTSRTLVEGWLRFYQPYFPLKNEKCPMLCEGQKVVVHQVTLNSLSTKPPSRYNPRTLLIKMEKECIGTKATRATTIQTLFERNYLKGTDNLVISDLGFEVAEVLSKYCPNVVSSEMTRNLEQEMEDIIKGKQTKAFVLKRSVESLENITTELKKQEKTIGANLKLVLQKVRIDEKTICVCPKCRTGKLVIVRSKKSGKRFVGCTNYFKNKCNISYPLPQTGIVKPLKSACKSCGAPIVRIYFKQKKTWQLCLNPQCISKVKDSPSQATDKTYGGDQNN